MMKNCFCSMVDQQKVLALLPIRTIVRETHHREFLTHCKQDFHLAEPDFRLWCMKFCSTDNHYTTSPKWWLYQEKSESSVGVKVRNENSTHSNLIQVLFSIILQMSRTFSEGLFQHQESFLQGKGINNSEKTFTRYLLIKKFGRYLIICLLLCLHFKIRSEKIKRKL